MHVLNWIAFYFLNFFSFDDIQLWIGKGSFHNTLLNSGRHFVKVDFFYSFLAMSIYLFDEYQIILIILIGLKNMDKKCYNMLFYLINTGSLWVLLILSSVDPILIFSYACTYISLCLLIEDTFFLFKFRLYIWWKCNFRLLNEFIGFLEVFIKTFTLFPRSANQVNKTNDK